MATTSRNQAYMGEQAPTMIQGIVNRTPQANRSLIAPINIQRPQQQVQQVQQVQQGPDMNAIMAQFQRQRQQQQQEAQKLRQQTLEAQQAALVTQQGMMGEGDERRDNSVTANPNAMNQAYSPQLAAALKGAFGLNSMANQFGAGIPTGGIGGLAGAQNTNQALGAAGVGVAGMINPVLGLVTGLANSYYQKKAAEEQRVQEQAAKNKAAEESARNNSNSATNSLSAPGVPGQLNAGPLANQPTQEEIDAQMSEAARNIQAIIASSRYDGGGSSYSGTNNSAGEGLGGSGYGSSSFA